MATTVNQGRSFFIQNITVNSGVQTPFTVPAALQNTYNVNAMIIKCRTAADMTLTLNKGDGNYFTIPSGTSLLLDINTIQPVIGYLSAGSNVVAEILMKVE